MANENTILVTGFDPFGGETINPAWEAVSRLPDEIGACRVEKLCVPTVFGEAGRVALERAARVRLKAVLCVGQAGGRSAVTPEMVAINLRHARIPDNADAEPHDEPVLPGGENALFTTLPVRAMTSAMLDAGVPAEVSYTAGTYVCNDLMYLMLLHCAPLGISCGFVHVPAGGELDTETVARGLCAAIEVLTR